MTDAITDFMLSVSFHGDDIDPLNWYLSTYHINRTIYDSMTAKLQELGYKEE